MREIEARLQLSQEDVAYLWNGGTLAIKIDGAETRVSIDVSCARHHDGRRQSVRIKRIQAKRQAAE